MPKDTIAGSSLALIVIATLWAGPSQAADGLSPAAAVTEALARNPEVKAADRQVDAAHAREAQASAWPNPNVSLQLDQVPYLNPAGGNYLVGVGQPLLPPGLRALRAEAARLDTRLAEYDRDVLRQDLRARVKEAYYQLLFELAGTKLARATAAAARAQLAATRARLKAGEVAPIEVLRAELEANRAERDVSAAEARTLEAGSKLNVLMGRPSLAALAAPSSQPAVAQAPLPALEVLVKRALANRVELRQAEAMIRREALQRQIARTGIWTGTEVNAATGMVAGQLAFSTSLSVPIPVYRQQGEIAEAEANRARAEAKREALVQTISLEAHQAYNEADRAARQVALFNKTYLPQARQLLENAQIRLKVGEGTGFELAEARRAYHETSIELLRAELEYRQAIAHLEHAAGQEPLQP